MGKSFSESLGKGSTSAANGCQQLAPAVVGGISQLGEVLFMIRTVAHILSLFYFVSSALFYKSRYSSSYSTAYSRSYFTAYSCFYFSAYSYLYSINYSVLILLHILLVIIAFPDPYSTKYSDDQGTLSYCCEVFRKTRQSWQNA